MLVMGSVRRRCLMISWGEADKLARMHAPEPTVLSLYLTVLVDPAELRGLPARVGELMTAAAGGPAGEEYGRLRDEDRGAVRAKVAAHGRDWRPCSGAPHTVWPWWTGGTHGSSPSPGMRSRRLPRRPRRGFPARVSAAGTAWTPTASSSGSSS